MEIGRAARHCLTYRPFAKWCAICAKARAKDMVRNKIKIKDGPDVVQFDCAFMRSGDMEKLVPSLIAITKRAGYVFAGAVRVKGTGDVDHDPVVVARSRTHEPGVLPIGRRAGDQGGRGSRRGKEGTEGADQDRVPEPHAHRDYAGEVFEFAWRSRALRADDRWHDQNATHVAHGGAQH